MFVTMYAKYETPHEVELVKSALIDQGIPKEDICLLRDQIALLIYAEKELEDEIRTLLEERGAQALSVREQPTMDQGLDESEIWKNHRSSVSADEASKMPHAGPLENPNQPELS